MNVVIKDRLISVLEKGPASALVNDIITICIRSSLAYTRKHENPITIRRIMNDNGFENETALAIDCIAEIFEVRENKYYQLNDYFSYGHFDPHTAVEEEIISKLRSLSWNATNKRLFELKDSHYVHLRNSLNNCIRRKPAFKKLRLSDNIYYVHTCEIGQIDINTPQITSEKLVEFLISEKLDEPDNPQLMEVIFDYINNQSEFCKAINYNTIVQAVANYDKQNIYVELDDEKNKNFKITPFNIEFKEKLDRFINENRQFKKHYENKELFIYTCKSEYLNFLLNQYPLVVLIKILRGNELKDINIASVLGSLFISINNQNNYNKALCYHNLHVVLRRFYNRFI